LNKILRPKNPYFKSTPSQGKVKIRWGVLIFWLILIGGAVYFFAYSSFFNISDIIVEGTKSVNPDEVKAIAENYQSQEDNLFKYPVEKVEQDIAQKFLLVDKVNVTRGVPKTIKIEVVEREGFLIWQTNGKNYLVDKKGIVFKETEDTFSLPQVVDEQNRPITLGEKILTQNFIKFINSINVNLSKKTKTKIKKIIVRESTFELDVLTDKGWKIIFDTTRSANDQIAALKKILPYAKNKIKDYLDLRVPNWAYYK
jgi:cell division septal protein FtsQ